MFQRFIPFKRKLGVYEHWNGKGNEQQIGNNIQDTHNNRMTVGLTTRVTLFSAHNPVILEWMAFSKIYNNGGNKRESKENVEYKQHAFVELLQPGLLSQTSKEHGNAVFDSP